jgi:hypothetical protein
MADLFQGAVVGTKPLTGADPQSGKIVNVWKMQFQYYWLPTENKKRLMADVPGTLGISDLHMASHITWLRDVSFATWDNNKVGA